MCNISLYMEMSFYITFCLYAYNSCKNAAQRFEHMVVLFHYGDNIDHDTQYNKIDHETNHDEGRFYEECFTQENIFILETIQFTLLRNNNFRKNLDRD